MLEQEDDEHSQGQKTPPNGQRHGNTPTTLPAGHWFQLQL
jgi:hypothetical protein